MTFSIKELMLAILATFVITMTCAYGCARRAVRQGEAAAAAAVKDAKGHEDAATKLADKIKTDADAVNKSRMQAYALSEKVTAARRKANQGEVAVPKTLPVDVPALQALVVKQEVEIENYKELTDTQAQENAALKLQITDMGKQLADTQMQSDEWKKAYLSQQVATNAYHDAMKRASFRSGFKGFIGGVIIAEAANLASKRK